MLNLKNIIITTSLFFGIPAFAQEPETTRLPKDALALSPIAGRVISVEPLCPEGVICIANGTVVKIRFQLLGCADELAPITYEAKEDMQDETLEIFLSATNVHTARSQAVLCKMLPYQDQTITLVNQYGDVNVHFLGVPHQH